MKTNLIKTLAMMGWLSYAAIATSAEADKAPGSVTFNSGKVMIPDGGKSVEAIKEVTLPGDVLVKTNGAFTVAKGATRQLLEGQLQRAETARLHLSADQLIAPPRRIDINSATTENF